MKLFRTKNLRALLYCIIRQLEKDSKVLFLNLNQKTTEFMIIGDIQNSETAICAMKDFSKLRQQLQNGDRFLVTIMDSIFFGIRQDIENPEYYIIDNVYILLNYLIFNNIIDTKKLYISILDKENTLKKEFRLNVESKYSEQTIFFEKRLCKAEEVINKISINVNSIALKMDKAKIMIKTDYDLIVLEVINYC